MPDTQTTTDAADAAAIATEAGLALLELREGLSRGERKPEEMRDAGDAASHELIMRLLAERHPDDAVLSEEGKDDTVRLEAARTWIVDPLNGTREFGELGRSDWAVHVALVERESVTAAAVALPALGLTLSTDPAPASPPPAPARPRIVVSRTRPPAVAQHVAEVLGGDLVEMGSAGAKTLSVVRGETDVYVHAGGQYEWDSAAPTGVAAAGGCHVSRIDGSPLRYNQANPWLPDLLVCRAELAAAVLAAVANA